MPVITSDITIVNQLETRSFTIRYTPTPRSVATFDTYRFMLSDPSIPVKEKSAVDDDRKVNKKIFCCLLACNNRKIIDFKVGVDIFI